MNGIVIEQASAPQKEADALLDAAFGLDRRTKASYRLREGSRPVDGLSFTARTSAGRLVGVISFWPLVIAPEGREALLLGPLAVHPDVQSQGIGAALIERGLQAADAQGHDLIFLVGDAPYYERFGFAPVVPHGRILLPGPFDPARLLFRARQAGALNSVQGLLLPPWRYQAGREKTRA